jgi:tape measure domain-containing protein
MLSDVTGGNNERFKMMSLAFSQTSAAGRLMGQDLLQMINAGFNPLQQISKITGESMLTLKKRMEDGGISAEEVRRAFEAATAEGGMFHGMTERLADTMGGRLNIAYSNFEKFLADAGAAMGPLVIELTEGFEQGTSVMNGMLKVIEKIVDGLRAMIALGKDISWTSVDAEMPAFNKLLDEMEKRDRDRADAEANKAALKFENEKKVIEAVAEVDHKAIEANEKERLKAVKEWERAQKKAIEESQRAQEKAIKDAAKLRDDAEKAWAKELADARKEAMKFFEEREKQNKKLREDVAKGPGSGFEVGSTSAMKFMADAANAQIAKAAVPDDPMLRNRDVAQKTAEILIATREANVKAQQQIDLAERQLREMQENGFRRIR